MIGDLALFSGSKTPKPFGIKLDRPTPSPCRQTFFYLDDSFNRLVCQKGQRLGLKNSVSARSPVFFAVEH